MRVRHLTVAAVAGLGLVLAGCSSSPSTTAAGVGTASVAADGVRVVSPTEGHDLLAAAPTDLVVLDVRTPAEFAEGHLPDAINIDLQGPGFRDQVASLDRDAPILLYCRSGNRSAQAREIMAGMGFSDVADVDGGILSWQAAGLPVEG